MDKTTIVDAIAREMHTGVLVIDRCGRILYANPFFRRCFPLDGGLEGRRIEEIIGRSSLLRAVKEFLRKEERSGEAVEITEGDRYFKVRLVPIKEKGKDGLLLFLQDITEEKRVEAIKRDFVANVSHELRTPLASIKGYSETLLDGGMEDPETLREFLTIIDKHATRMSRLIDDLLILSKIESQKVPTVFERIDMGELTSSTSRGFERQAKDKGIHLSLHIAKGVPKVLGDRDQLEQVMLNLLDNAIKYTPSGGRIDVSVYPYNGLVRVDVKDTGIGIPQADIPRIFERFYRVDKARSRELGGTGLGLAIVKHIIQGLNGRVWVESTPGKGSTFSFTLQPADE